jgi:hypothetical protein
MACLCFAVALTQIALLIIPMFKPRKGFSLGDNLPSHSVETNCYLALKQSHGQQFGSVVFTPAVMLAAVTHFA